MTNDEKLLNFQSSAMEAARQKSSDMIQEFEASLNQTFEDHSAEKRRQAELQIKTEHANLQRQKNKVLSMKQMELKQIINKKQNELKEHLFLEVRDMLDQFILTSDYDRLLINQIKKDVAFARGQKIIIYIDPEDSKKQRMLEEAAGIPLTVSEYSFLGGTRAVIPEQNILIDDSFQTKLEEAHEEFSFNGGGTSHE